MALEWIASFGREGNVYPHRDSSMQESIDMWADIDGHLLLYAFLPALLFGDAVGLNVHMFQQTFSQCLLLACPGVLLGTFATGLAAMYTRARSRCVVVVAGGAPSASAPPDGCSLVFVVRLGVSEWFRCSEPAARDLRVRHARLQRPRSR